MSDENEKFDVNEIEGIPIKPKRRGVPIQIYITAEMHAELKRLCEVHDHTMRDAVEFGIRAYLARYGRTEIKKAG